MSTLRRQLGENWFFMTTPPWDKIEMTNYSKKKHILIYITGWSWVLSGIIAGSLLSQPLLDEAGIRNTALETPISIGIAIGLGFIVQLAGWIFLIPISTNAKRRSRVDNSGCLINYLGGSIISVVVLWLIKKPGSFAATINIVLIGLAIGIILSLFLRAFAESLGSFVAKTIGGQIVGPNNSDVTKSAYAYGLVLPLFLNAFLIYVFLHFFGANYNITNKTVIYAVFIKAIIYPAIGKVLTVLGFGHLFTGLKTVTKVLDE